MPSKYKIIIYDPRENKNYDFELNSGMTWSSVKNKSLVLEMQNWDFIQNDRFHRGLLQQFKSDRALIHVNWLDRREAILRLLETKLGKKSLRHEEFLEMFDYDDILAGRFIESLKEVGDYEQWLYAGYIGQSEDEVQALNFDTKFAIDSIMSRSGLFDYITFFDLDTDDWTFFCHREDCFDDVLEYIGKF